MLTIDQFLEKYQNKSWDFDGQFSAQCFDLFQFYNRDVVGAPFVTGAGAKDIWNTYPKDFYERIDNGATNYPKKADVMIWGSAYGPYGHVAICSEDGNPQTDSFTVLSQNDPAGVPSIYKTYSNWKGVLGWLRPKPKQAPSDPCADVKRTLALTEQDNKTKQAMIDDLKNNLSASNSKLKPLQERVNKLEAFVQSIKELTLKV